MGSIEPIEGGQGGAAATLRSEVVSSIVSKYQETDTETDADGESSYGGSSFVWWAGVQSCSTTESEI